MDYNRTAVITGHPTDPSLYRVLLFSTAHPRFESVDRLNREDAEAVKMAWEQSLTPPLKDTGPAVAQYEISEPPAPPVEDTTPSSSVFKLNTETLMALPDRQRDALLKLISQKLALVSHRELNTDLVSHLKEEDIEQIIEAFAEAVVK